MTPKQVIPAYDTESVNADLTTSNLTVNIHITFFENQYIIDLCKTY